MLSGMWKHLYRIVNILFTSLILRENDRLYFPLLWEQMFKRDLSLLVFHRMWIDAPRDRV